MSTKVKEIALFDKNGATYSFIDVKIRLPRIIPRLISRPASPRFPRLPPRFPQIFLPFSLPSHIFFVFLQRHSEGLRRVAVCLSRKPFKHT